MALTEARMWPLWMGAALLVGSAIVELVTRKVPNALSLATLLAGLATAALASLRIGPLAGNQGGVGSSLLSVLAAAVVLVSLKLAAGDWVPGGSVKMQIAFAAWVGCVFSATQSLGAFFSFTAVGIVFTGVATLATAVLPEEGTVHVQAFLALGTIAGMVGYFRLLAV